MCVCARLNFPVRPWFFVLVLAKHSQISEYGTIIYIYFYCAQATVNVSNFWLESTKFIHAHTRLYPIQNGFDVWFDFSGSIICQKMRCLVCDIWQTEHVSWIQIRTRTQLCYLQALITHQLSQLSAVCFASNCSCRGQLNGKLPPNERIQITREWRSKIEHCSIIRF